MNNQLAEEIKAELLASGDNYPLTVINGGKTVIIEIPEGETFTARNVMQGFNTPRFRARRVQRSLVRVEVKYRS